MRARAAAVIVVALTCAWQAAPGVAATGVCLPGARAAVSRVLGVRRASITTSTDQGGNGMPQCNFAVRRARSGGPRTRVRLTVNIDNGPQAAWRLLRTVVEAQQLWGGTTPSGKKRPIGQTGLGEFASWFPELDALMANNHDRRELLTVSVVWPRARRAEMIRLARAVIIPYRRRG